MNLSSPWKIPSQERERLTGERREGESENLPLLSVRMHARGREGEREEEFPPREREEKKDCEGERECYRMRQRRGRSHERG